MLAQTYPYTARYWYEHMAANDRPIWERMIATHPTYFDTVQYDVPVGDTPEHSKEPVVDGGGSMERLYKRKIDVVGHSTAIIWIVEVKPKAGTSTVGQVLGYKHLYDRDYSPATETRPLIVCESIDKDALEFAAAQGVGVLMV